MQTAQLHQDVEPTEIGFTPGVPNGGADYKQMAQDAIDRVGERVHKLKQSSSSVALSLGSRLWLGGWARGALGLGVATVVVGGALAWEYPRSETVRSYVNQWAPQALIDRLPAVDGQDMDANAGTFEARLAGTTSGSFGSTGQDMSGNATGAMPAMEQQMLIQKLARDVENLQQSIDQLRAGQDQMMRMMMRPATANAQARAPMPLPTRPNAPTTTTGYAATQPSQPSRSLATQPPQQRAVIPVFPGFPR